MVRILIIVLLTTCLLNEVSGQNNSVLSDEKKRLVLFEYLLSYHLNVKDQISGIERHLYTSNYKVGDSFELEDSLHILNHFTDSTIIFDIDKNSTIPPGFVVKIIKEWGDFYLLEGKNKNEGYRLGYIQKESLDTFFFPENDFHRGLLFEAIKTENKKLEKYILNKYNLSDNELEEMVDSAFFSLRNKK